MKRFPCFLAIIFVFSAPILIAAENELFPFVISFDAPDNVTNVSKQLDTPAGRHGFVRVENGQFVTDAGQIKFWGTNTCFEANFLDHEAADRMAARLARFGANCVRLHHLDSRNIWGTGRSESQMTFDPGQMDKLDYYIAALKKRGIYVNMNLHVSRVLDERDGFPPRANRPMYDKGIDNYYRPFIEANKKYAWDLLTHVNPYTGNAYKDEPAVAMIEINNENSILAVWGGWPDSLEIIDAPFLSDLQIRWNDWLKTKYGDDDALQKAWNCRTAPLGGEMLINADFSEGYVPDGTDWRWEGNANTDAPILNVNGVLRMDVRKKGNVDWQPLLISSGVTVKKDQIYTLEIKAKASQNTRLSAILQMNRQPWEVLGFDSQIRLTESWQTFRFMVKPTVDAPNARLIIVNFNEGVEYEIESVSLKPGGTVGLLAEGTIPVVWKREIRQYPKEMGDDFCDFLMEIEAKYWDEMYRYLKDEIQVKQPVSGTQLGYGSTHAQAAMDYCDIHAYWDHPENFLQENWYLRNRALVNSLDRDVLPQLATKRVVGKPFTLSEYNHPFPNQYAAEGFPILAAFGAFQDWSGIFAYSYSHSNDPEPQKVTSYFFDTCGHTVQTAHMIACQALFNADLKVAPENTIIAPLTTEKEHEIFLQDRSHSNFSFRGLGLDPRLALTNRVAIDASGAVKEMPSPEPIPSDQKIFGYNSSDQSIISFNMTVNDAGYADVTTQNAALFTGFIHKAHSPSQTGRYFLRRPDWEIVFGQTNLNWATVSLTTIEKDKRFLLVATGEMCNTDMVLESLGDGRVTAGQPPWGRAPVLCEGIPATILLKGIKSDAIRYWPLDESGDRREELKGVTVYGDTAIVLKSEYKTIWYEIEIQ